MTKYMPIALATFLMPVLAFAEEAAHAATTGGMGSAAGVALAVGLGIGIAVFGAATAQGKVAAAFMEGVARNPGAGDVLRTQLILSLALVESLALLAWVIVFLLMGKM